MSEKFVSPCPPLPPREREIIETLIEEASEVIQRATKMLRFGRDEVQPGQELSNRWRLSEEVGDFLAMVKIAEEADLLDWKGVQNGERRKPGRFAKYRQHGQEEQI